MSRLSSWHINGLALCVALAPLNPVAAFWQGGGSNRARITGLTDVNFGLVTNFGVDSIRSQSVCLYARSPPPPHNYRVTASGSGIGGTFQLVSGSNTIAYEVQWSDSAGQTSGAQMMANVPLTGLNSDAGQDDCRNGPATTASLIVILRSAAVGSAMAGSYSGSLTLLVAPE